jgi:hypothetical protein
MVNYISSQGWLWADCSIAHIAESDSLDAAFHRIDKFVQSPRITFARLETVCS